MPQRSPEDRSNLQFLAGGGEMGARMRALDWSTTILGPPDTWPQSLRSTLSLLLPSKAQIILFWGPELLCFYNDAYRPVFGAKHPHFLGKPGREAWSEIWQSMLHDLLAGVVRTGEAFWAKDLLFEVERFDFLEETYFDVSYDPVRVESGLVGGVFCIVTETTERVIGERRMALLKDLAARNATARTARDACALAMETLAARPQDVTFALAYVDGGLQAATPAAEEQLAGAAPELIKELPIASGREGRYGRLVVGLNPRRPFDQAYRAFLDLVADQIGTALVNARAYEQERERAEALAEIDRTKTAFFSNVSHEFRTPLTLLLGPVQDALATPDRSLSPEALASVNRNALRLLKLVNTLLDFARIEAGRAEASFEATQLDRFTSELAGAFRSAIESAGLRFDVTCECLGKPVHVDRSMWEKIVFNLLSNALKFTFEGHIRLSLTPMDGTARLRVSDTGIGIAPGELPHVFDRFHRVRSARARTHEGTGIGLSLVQELVRLHQGTIRVESVPGKGTTFAVDIPLAERRVAGETVGAPRAPSATSVSADAYVSEALGWLNDARDGTAAVPFAELHPARVLLADDNADMREYVGRLLGERWRVETVADGATALAAAQRERPDIVVTDVMMPELDGFELLAALRADPRTHDVPVVLLSARAGEEATLRGIEAGADDYLVKPFTARDLLARVEAQLSRARAREAAREFEQRFRAFVTATADAVYTMSPDWTEMRHLEGRNFIPDTVDPSRSWIDRYIHTDDQPAVLAAIRRAIDTKTIFEHEHRVIRRDGSFEWTVSRAVPIFDASGEINEWFGTARDITDRKRAENALRESERRLSEANRVKDEFLATLSHELRTPLNAVLGWAHMLRTGTLRPDVQQRALHSLERNAKIQAQLVDDLLDVSRIMSGKLALLREPLDLTAVIAEAVDAIRPTVTAKGLRLGVGMDPGAEIVIDGDAHRLQQIVGNLLSNAVRFTPAGGSVDVDLQSGRDHVEIVVRDSGEGIDASFLPHVFERFRQAESSPSRRHGGLGLGLAIVRHFTEAHGGTVSAHSDGLGKGATFVVRLPLDTARPRQLPAPALEHHPADDLRLSGVRVLVADDEPDAREVTRTVLESTGARVVAVASSGEALNVLQHQAFDALVADIGMPDQDGYSLIRAVRSLSDASVGAIPAIAVTAYATLAERKEALAAGFNAHVGKPVDPKQLVAAVAAALNAAKSVPALDPAAVRPAESPRTSPTRPPRR